MCFYTSNSKRALALARRYGKKTDIIEIAQEIIEEQYRISAFTHPSCPIITANQNVEVAKWGLIPHWTKSVDDANKYRNMCLNARSETVFGMPSFHSPILSKRCLIPVTGYFEFHHHEKTTSPYYIHLMEEDIFSLGGLYEQWRHPVSKEIIQTFTILTVTANKLCAEIHNGGKNPFRMPLIIKKEDEEDWLKTSLSTNDIMHFFTPFDDACMHAYPVSKDFLKMNPKDASIIIQAA